MYYLQSRYYDPAIGRFINADCYASTGQGFLGYNMFAYCLNNPVNYVDSCGLFVLAATIGAITIGELLFDFCVSMLFAAAIYEITYSSRNSATPLQTSYSPKPLTPAAAAENTTPSYYQSTRNGLPSPSKVTIRMSHIMSGHSAGGNRGGPNKDRFPRWMTYEMIERAIRGAYNNAHKIGPLQHSFEKGIEMTKQLFEGYYQGLRIQFWFNYTLRTIETAWPKY